MIKVAVCGANGKMGKELVNAINNDSQAELVAKIDIVNGEFSSIEDASNATDIDVLVDFTQPNAIYQNALFCLNNNINIVIGTTGLTDEQIENLKQLSNENQVACFIAPNFSTGAVLMMKFAQMAAKYFDNAEIIELHHNQKKDAPSGTAVKTAQLMASENKSFVSGNCQEVETISGARGAESYSNIHIHSIRMPGFMASQEVLFGSDGQTLSIRHDSTNRSCYMPGVLMAIKYAFENKNFTYGLDNIL